MKEYRSISHSGTSLYEEKKSEFLGYAFPVETEEAAVEFVQSIKKKHPDARHHVYAYVLRDQYKSRYTDDGEPSGTAGMPVLDCIKKSNLTDCVVIVVRYFGGTLLGTGGLVRAYTSAASSAISDGEVVTYRTMQRANVTVSYPDYQKLLTLFSTLAIDSTDFGSDISISFHMPEEELDPILHQITEITSGRASVLKGEIFFGK
jgi:uncharacterized YigZ family protein